MFALWFTLSLDPMCVCVYRTPSVVWCCTFLRFACLLPPSPNTHTHTHPKQIIESLERASKVPQPPVSAMFTDVYAEMPWHLKEQLADTLQLIKRHPHLLPPDMAAE